MNQDDRSGFRRSFGEMNGPSHMRGQMSVVFTRWNYPVEHPRRRRQPQGRRKQPLPGGITRWNYPVELPGGIRGFRRRLPGVRRNRLPRNTRPDATQLNAHVCSN